jgi:uncharacterized protein
LKYSINQLIKNGSEPFKIDETVDFSNVAELHHEIRKISKVSITGTGQLSGKNVLFDLNIVCELTLPCALTLVDVLYPLNIKTREIFTFDETVKEEDLDDDVTIVKGQTIELAPIIWQNIVLHIPLRVVSENARERMPKSGENWELVDENNQENQIDPRFAILKDLLKKD